VDCDFAIDVTAFKLDIGPRRVRGVALMAEFSMKPTDEARGDLGDQASRLQMEEEQAANARLDERVYGNDSSVDLVTNEEMDLDPKVVDGSDDPVFGGGMPFTDPEEAAFSSSRDELLERELAMTGLDEDGAAMIVDEEASEDLLSVDDETAAEDIDALIDVFDVGHDPDDPLDPDGYGVPPGPGTSDGAFHEAEFRDPIHEASDPKPYEEP